MLFNLFHIYPIPISHHKIQGIRIHMKILTIFGTRPEAIKLFPLLHAFDAQGTLQSRVCVSAQHREMLDQVLEIGGITPDHDLDIMTPGQSLDALTARLLTDIGEVMDQEKPDRVIVQGDTATAMVGALCAYYRKIPVGHVEAGLRSHNIYHPWPEEVNRKIVGSIADMHFAPTQTSADHLIAENVPADRIFITGNTVIDALQWVSAKIVHQPHIANKLDDLKARFAGKRIIGLTSHRRENFDGGMEAIASAVSELARRDDVAIIFPVHPNPNVRGVMEKALAGYDNIALIDPLDYPNFVNLLNIADIMLTDSGGVQEEAPALGKPVLVMRETTERPEGVEAGTARLVGTDCGRIVGEVTRLLDDAAAYRAMAQAVNPYGDGKAAQRIAALCAGRQMDDI